jgi:predicted MFS family arabinose efflux permease
MAAVKGGLRPRAAAPVESSGMLAEMRDGWGEFTKHTWVWAIVLQYGLVMMAWNGGFMVLGPAVAKAHLGGAAAWGAISAAEALGLIGGGLLSLRYTPRRPMLFVVGTGLFFALPPLLLGFVAPLPLICLTSFCVGILTEVMMVQWTLALTTRIAPDKLARVFSYDAFGSMAAMPLGALVAGPLAAGIGVPSAQFAAAAVTIAASACTLLPREVWTMRSDDVTRAGPESAEPGGSAPGTAEPNPMAMPL